MQVPANDRTTADKTALGLRLDSWKEIATYLGRGERTVKRWEQDRGLPIHRLPGGGHACVYAYAGELDEWLKSSATREQEANNQAARVSEQAGVAIDGPPAEKGPTLVVMPSPGLSTWRRKLKPWQLLGFSAALVVAVVGIAGLYARFRPFTVRDWAQKPSVRSGPYSIRVSDTEKALAHDFYLKGRYEWNQRTPESLNRALDNFTQCLVHDPSNAQAYVGLADTYLLLREYTTMPEAEAYSRAIAAARKAIELDDSLSEAHRALAFSLINGDWDFINGEKEFRRAIELNPSDSVAHLWYANALAVRADYRNSLEQIDRAQELDPSSHAILADKGNLLFKAGREKQGIELLKQVERSDPEFRSPHQYLMQISFLIGDYPTYLAEGEKEADARNDAVLRDILAAARAGYAKRGHAGLLDALYLKQKTYYSEGKLWGTALAKTSIKLGKKQEALQLLEEEYARHSPVFLWCLSEPDLLTLKNEPKYVDLVQRIALPSGSQERGR